MSSYDKLIMVFPVAVHLPYDRAVIVMNKLNVITDRFPSGSSYSWTADKEILYLSRASAQRIMDDGTVDPGIRGLVRIMHDQYIEKCKEMNHGW